MRKIVTWASTLLVAVAGSVVALAVPAVAAEPFVGEHAILSRHMNKYISAEVSFTGTLEGVLRARADHIAGYEMFYIDAIGNGYYTIESVARWEDSLYANQHKVRVRAELNYPGADDGMLRAMGDYADGAQTVEQYQITPVPGAGGWYTIKNRSAGKYLKAESGYATGNPRDGMIRAAESNPGLWTTHFKFLLP